MTLHSASPEPGLLENLEIRRRIFGRLALLFLINFFRQNLNMAFIGDQVQFLPFHAQFPPQIRMHDDSALRIHFDIGPQVRRVKRDVFGRFRILLKAIEKFLIYSPFRDRIQLSYAAIETRQIQLALRQTPKKLYEIRRKFKPRLIIETPRVSPTGKFENIRRWLLIRHFLSTFSPLA